LEHNPSDEVIASFMRSRALKGFLDLCPAECWEVVNYVIGQSKRCEYRLDLRHMEHGWQDYRLWKHGESVGVHWKELIATSMQQMVRQEELLWARRAIIGLWRRSSPPSLKENYVELVEHIEDCPRAWGRCDRYGNISFAARVVDRLDDYGLRGLIPAENGEEYADETRNRAAK
jgi:hypothetical protein